MGLDVVWIPETSYRGISDNEVINLANRDEKIVLTRDSDYLKPSLRRKAKYGIIYIGEPIRKDNVKKLAKNVAKALEIIKEKPFLVIVTSSTIELYPLTL
jgi:predicted nuclease of predicted toxin-antitoxin system